ncbi:hypothetical protein ALP99_200032 [Pseudomonas syringae pv. tomato]|uniref:Uncharacterized protein n=1 Tax=Pseudomonas syringae pv. tomato TaxID=323 RepID=A0AAQ0N760_PSEUB|nr:hypothetical protein PST407_05705 [Pseudomonas syringae pv. tomato]KUR47143.1 hypothetical protein PSTA9_01783 [Pseudomonas syringae pv. tomato]RMQ67400.1 hypothetical protein ALP99_200032 [Pseudomonas syringae pv. tomato]CAI8817473.1 hypothetical protein DAPPPG215_09515 [Pseudomonas syringae pv. tomato]
MREARWQQTPRPCGRIWGRAGRLPFLRFDADPPCGPAVVNQALDAVDVLALRASILLPTASRPARSACLNRGATITTAYVHGAFSCERSSCRLAKSDLSSHVDMVVYKSKPSSGYRISSFTTARSAFFKKRYKVESTTFSCLEVGSYAGTGGLIPYWTEPLQAPLELWSTEITSDHPCEDVYT